MDARAERNVREFELAVLSVEVQIDPRQIASYHECDEIPEAVANTPSHAQPTFIRRNELIGLERRLTSTHTEKEAVRVHLLAGSRSLPWKWAPLSPRQERYDGTDRRY